MARNRDGAMALGLIDTAAEAVALLPDFHAFDVDAQIKSRKYDPDSFNKEAVPTTEYLELLKFKFYSRGVVVGYRVEDEGPVPILAMRFTRFADMDDDTLSESKFISEWLNHIATVLPPVTTNGSWVSGGQSKLFSH